MSLGPSAANTATASSHRPAPAMTYPQWKTGASSFEMAAAIPPWAYQELDISMCPWRESGMNIYRQYSTPYRDPDHFDDHDIAVLFREQLCRQWHRAQDHPGFAPAGARLLLSFHANIAFSSDRHSPHSARRKAASVCLKCACTFGVTYYSTMRCDSNHFMIQ